MSGIARVVVWCGCAVCITPKELLRGVYYTGKKLFEYLCGVYYTVEAVARCVLHREEAFCVLMRCVLHHRRCCAVHITPGRGLADVGWAQKQRFFKKCQRKIQIYYDYEDKLGTVS